MGIAILKEYDMMEKKDGKDLTTMKRILCFLLCAVLLLAMTACAQKTPAPDTGDAGQESAQAEPAPGGDSESAPAPDAASDPAPAGMPDIFDVPAEDGSVYVKDGLKLTVPDEYADLVLIGQGTPLFGGDNLFSAREIASMESGERSHPGEDWGDGALFGIGRMSEDEVHKFLCGYLNNERVFARDAENYYYVLYRPSDVRFFRDDMENIADSPDLQLWSEMNDWAASIPEIFTELNGLEPWNHGGSEAEMMLYRIAYQDDTFFMLNSLDYGELYPEQREPSASFAKQMLDGTSFEFCDESETPDGEYFVIDFPNDALRLDFFKGADYVRADYGDYQELMRITGQEKGYCVKVMEQWCQALQKAGG